MSPTSLLRRMRAGTRVALYLVLALGLSTGGWVGLLQLTGNIHPVTDGVVYRSAQLNGTQLAETLQKYKIRSVVNLRGDNVGENWYTDELTVTATNGVAHYDIGMYAKREPDIATVKRIFEVLRTAARPLLIHCNSGADRTGLVAAIYKHFVEGRSADEAAHQLSFRYGHFPWLGSGTVAMDQTFKRLTSSSANSPSSQASR